MAVKTSIPFSFVMLLVFVLPIRTVSASQISWLIENLGSLGGYSRAFGINDEGEVIGESEVAPGDVRGFIFSGGGIHALNSAGGNYESARAISNSSIVAGISISRTVRATMWLANTPSPLAGFDDDNLSSSANGISDLGIVVGSSQHPDGGTRPVMWQDETMIELPLGTASGGVAISIGDGGHIVGWADGRPALWLGSGIFFLDTLSGASGGVANSVSATGEIVGWSNPFISDFSTNHATLWTSNSVIDLDTLGGTSSNAWAINSAGWIVGESLIPSDSESHAVLWRNGDTLDLSTLPEVTEAGWAVLGQATAVNDFGQIVGVGEINGQSRAFRLSPIQPVPIPATFWLFITGLLFCGRCLHLDSAKFSLRFNWFLW